MSITEKYQKHDSYVNKSVIVPFNWLPVVFTYDILENSASAYTEVEAKFVR